MTLKDSTFDINTSDADLLFLQEVLYSQVGARTLLANPLHLSARASSSPNVREEDSALVSKWITECLRNPTPENLENISSDSSDFSVTGLAVFAAQILGKLKLTNQSQSVFVRGNNSLDKWSQTQGLVDHLLKVSAKKNANPIPSKIASATRLFGSFLHCSINENSNVPFGGLCIELLFDGKHRISGAQFLDFLLNPSLLTKGSFKSMTSFNVLSTLMEGGTPALCARLCLPTVPSSHADSNAKFESLIQDFAALDITGKTLEAVLDVLAAVYHLCSLEFTQSNDAHSPTLVVNSEVLIFISALLHVPAEHLQVTLLTATVDLHGERCTKFLSPSEALARVQHLAETLYVLLFKWLLEFANTKLTKKFKKSAPASSVSILHLPEVHTTTQVYREWNELVKYASDCLDYFSIVDAARTHSFFAQYNVPISPFKLIQAFPENPLKDQSRLKLNLPNLTVAYDLLSLFHNGCASNFVQDLFRMTSLSIAFDEGRSGEIQNKALRRPFIKVKKLKKASALPGAHGSALMDLQSSLEELLNGIQVTPVHYLFCHFDSSVQAFLRQLQAFPKKGRLELFITYDDLIARYNPLFAMHSISEDQSPADRVLALLTSINVQDSILDPIHGAWLSWNGIFLLELHYRLYRDWKKSNGGADAEDADDLYSESSYSNSKDPTDVASDVFDIFCAQLDNASEANSSRSRNRRANRTVSIYSSISQQDDARSEVTLVGSQLSKVSGLKKFQELPPPGPILPEPLAETKNNTLRNRWLFMVKFATFWIPGFMLSAFGKKSSESQMAWREKFTIFSFIVFLSGISLFLILYAGIAICPRKNYFSPYELNSLSSNPNISVSFRNPLRIYSAIRGNVYNLGELTNDNSFHNDFQMRQLQGMELSAGFPNDLNRYCGSLLKGSTPFRFTQQSNPISALISANHDKGGDNTARNIASFLNNRKKGVFAVTKDEVLTGWTSKAFEVPLKRFIYKNKVYDLTDYYLTTANGAADRFLGFDFKLTTSSETFKLDQYIAQQALEGNVDFSSDFLFQNLWASSSGARECIDNFFHVAYVDDRQTFKCLITNYSLFAVSMVLCTIIAVKFLAALVMSRTVQVPAKMDKFVMVQVPCYTEDEATLRQTLDALAVTDYDDKKKLLVFICDGMIVGRGNDRPTPRILLDLLGVDSTVHVPTFSYQALGEGRAQHNKAKVYTGLYEHRGHFVPYMVIVKTGLASEAIKPGNRGKRDSQMLLMRFLNKLHNQHPMSPLELEMRYQLQYVIGVDPIWYEYLLVVDADTVVAPNSLTQLVAFCMTDTDIIGCCGETRLMNEKRSFVTMIQVYEYFISHHLSKAFESMFGTVTCLPGCFSMYRIFSSRKNKPILASDQIIREYGQNDVNTLHEKNLLVLGEDRYLTTLILKAFPKMKTKFVPAAVANTIAPESFSVLISQRRRWINSTFHNLVELARLSNLCGFCLFSMRFVVLMELLATIIQPATVIYLFYMLYVVIDAFINRTSLDVVVISVIVLLVVYLGQALVFIVRKEFSHIIWMFLYLLSIPFFGLAIPLYSFWHMDDFSWGSTRKLNTTMKQRMSGVSFKSTDSGDIDLTKEIPHYSWNIYMSHHGASHAANGMNDSDDFNDSASVVSSSHSVTTFIPDMPSEDTVFAEIHRILKGGNLSLLTPSSVQSQLEKTYGLDMSLYRSYIEDMFHQLKRSG